MPRPSRSFPALVVAAVLAASTPARAASEQGDFAIKGLGGDVCRSFVQAAAEKSPQINQFRAWIEGYLTAVNRYRPDTFDVAPWQSTALLMTLIHAHCQRNPDQPLFEVVHQLQTLLARQRLTSKAQLVDITEGERRVLIYDEVLKRVQKILVERGLLNGTADGKFGPKTKAALEALQKEAGLPVTGLPDQETLFELLLKPELAG